MPATAFLQYAIDEGAAHVPSLAPFYPLMLLAQWRYALLTCDGEELCTGPRDVLRGFSPDCCSLVDSR